MHFFAVFLFLSLGVMGVTMPGERGYRAVREGRPLIAGLVGVALAWLVNLNMWTSWGITNLRHGWAGVTLTGLALGGTALFTHAILNFFAGLHRKSDDQAEEIEQEELDLEPETRSPPPAEGVLGQLVVGLLQRRFDPLVLRRVPLDEGHGEAEVDVRRPDVGRTAGTGIEDEKAGDESPDQDGVVGGKADGAQEEGGLAKDGVRKTRVVLADMETVTSQLHPPGTGRRRPRPAARRACRATPGPGRPAGRDRCSSCRGRRHDHRLG